MLHGGWFDATGDYGKHLSHLSFSTYFNPQQIPLTAWGLMKTLRPARGVAATRTSGNTCGGSLDEAAWGADYLVRARVPGGSFYRSVTAPGPGEAARGQARRPRRPGLCDQADQRGSGIGGPCRRPQLREYQSSFRAGGGVAIAALARASLDAPAG